MANSLFALGFHSVALFAVFSLFCHLGRGQLSTSLSSADQDRFADLFTNAEPFKDLATAHWAVNGLQLLGKQVRDQQAVCAYVQNAVDGKSLKSLFHASAVAQTLGCKLSVKDADETLSEAVKEGSTVETIYYAVSAQLDLGKTVDGSAVIAALNSALSDDDSARSATLSWLIVSRLPGENDLSSFTDAIEDVLQQADETTESLWFDSGIQLTSMFVTGAFGLSEKADTAPSGIIGTHLVKLTNYFLTNRFTQSPSDAYFVLAALRTLAMNKFQVPLVISLVGNQPITAENPSIKVRASDLLGRPVEPLMVTMVSAGLDDDTDLVRSEEFTAADNSVYEFNFWKENPSRGAYKAVVSATLQSVDSILIAESDVTFVVKVVVKVVVGSCTIQIVDKDQSLVAKSASVSFPDTSSEQLEADYHQRVVMKFSLKDTLSGDLITAHQTFVRLIHSDTKQEIFFVAEPNDENEYKFDLDVGVAATESFGSLGGKYQLDLIVGDAAIENPFSWTVCSISLTFAEVGSPSAPKEKFSAQPEIHHIFREPEPRPARVITVVFTALVIAPVLMLLILWLYLGANLSGLIQSGLPGILFSLGLGAILCLLFAFWLSLNMFTTLKLLAAVGVFTFVAGQRMLRNIAEKRA